MLTYEQALAIAQDRANRIKSFMYIFHLTSGGYYITSMVEFPYVDQEYTQIDTISPQSKPNDGEIEWWY